MDDEKNSGLTKTDKGPPTAHYRSVIDGEYFVSLKGGVEYARIHISDVRGNLRKEDE